MKRPLLLSGLIGALAAICGCGSSKPEVPSWFKSKDGGTKAVTKTNPRSEAEASLKEINGRLDQLQKKINTLDEVIAKSNERKKGIVEELNKLGIRSSEDLNKPAFKDNDEVKRNVQRLVTNRQQHAKLEELRKEFKKIHEDGKDARDQLEQDVKLAEAGITDKSLKDTNVAIKLIEERLDAKDPKNPVNEINADTIVDRELKKGGF
jgi:hypothetical protein